MRRSLALLLAGAVLALPASATRTGMDAPSTVPYDSLISRADGLYVRSTLDRLLERPEGYMVNGYALALTRTASLPPGNDLYCILQIGMKEGVAQPAAGLGICFQANLGIDVQGLVVWGGANEGKTLCPSADCSESERQRLNDVATDLLGVMDAQYRLEDSIEIESGLMGEYLRTEKRALPAQRALYEDLVAKDKLPASFLSGIPARCTVCRIDAVP